MHQHHRSLKLLAIAAPLFLFTLWRWPSRGLQCPAPWVSAKLATGASQSCVEVPTESPNWAVDICYLEGQCNQGSVSVRYLNQSDCTRMEHDLHPSLIPEQDTYVKSLLGPHTLSILFDGAVRAGAEEPEYLGGCTYRYPYHLHNGGAFALRVIMLYEVGLFTWLIPFVC